MAVTLSEATCAFCNGTGVDQTAAMARGSKCPVCAGRRIVYVQEPYVPCADCDGRGNKPGSRLTCLKCRGKGLVHQQAEPTGGYGKWWDSTGEGAWRS